MAKLGKKNNINIQAYMMAITLLAIIALFHFILLDWSEVISSPNPVKTFFTTGFIKPNSLVLVSRQLVITAIMAVGMVYVIISGEIDLSLGSQLALLGAILALLDNFLFNLGLPSAIAVPIVIISVLALGVLIGLWAGWWVAYRNVPSFIVTLAGMMAFRGIATILLGAKSISPKNPFYSSVFYQGQLPFTFALIILILAVPVMIFLTSKKRQKRQEYGLPNAPKANDYLKTILILALMGGVLFIFSQAKNIYVQSRFGGVPYSVFVLIILAIIFTWIGKYTVFGRHIYAVGGNLEATKLSGVNVRKTKMMVYAMNGFIISIAAIIMLSTNGTATSSAGSWQELYTIAACFIGGASMKGGIGTVYGAIIGGSIMGVLQAGMIQSGLDASWQQVIIGTVLLVAVYMDTAGKNGELSNMLATIKRK